MCHVIHVLHCVCVFSNPRYFWKNQWQPYNVSFAYGIDPAVIQNDSRDLYNLLSAKQRVSAVRYPCLYSVVVISFVSETRIAQISTKGDPQRCCGNCLGIHDVKITLCLCRRLPGASSLKGIRLTVSVNPQFAATSVDFRIDFPSAFGCSMFGAGGPESMMPQTKKNHIVCYSGDVPAKVSA